jgi:DNA-binding LacI/PurR family transcriptional regulator/anti-anti-sigma regulatory factor
MSQRRAIGLITRFISGRFFEQFLNGLQSVAWQHQVDVAVIHGTPDYVASTRIASQRVDGWLVLTYPKGIELLAEQGKPIVTASCHIPDQNFPAVLPDNRQGMQSVMEHLLECGHKRIAFVGDTSIGDIQERFLAYRAALESQNLPVDERFVICTDSPLADRGAQAARQLIERKITCTAVAAGNDWTAIGVMRELQAHGVRIPDDIAIVGFDDIPEAQITNPPLSTVRQRTDELGAAAGRLLLEQMAGQPAEGSILYIPTTFIARESSGNSLIQRISQWNIDGLGTAPLWRAALARELVRVLLPALPLDPTPSPVHVWPEVDKLVRLLGDTIEQTALQAIDPHLLEAIFSSPPILNANPEILVELLRVLELAGTTLIADRPDAEKARLRLSALLDQLHIEIIRSYRRRQTRSQRTMQEALLSQYNISRLLLECPPEQIDWLKEIPIRSGCLGLWAPSGGDQPPNLSIAGWYHGGANGVQHAGMVYPAPQFPPLDLLPSSAEQNDITTCLVLNIQTADHDWGMLAVSGPLISNDPWLEDNTINTIEICGGYLGLALEREALGESLRRSSEAELALADQIRQLSIPFVTVKEGVLLLPMAGILTSADSAPPVDEIMENLLRKPATDLLLDMEGVAELDGNQEGILIEIVQKAGRHGMRVAVVSAQEELQRKLSEKKSGLGGIPQFASVLLALKRRKEK